LGVTADNASANDTMIDSTAEIIDGFSGEENRVRCFNHIINLIAKSLLRLFEVSKKKRGAEAEVDEAEAALRELAGDLDLEDMEMQRDAFAAGGDIGVDDDDDVVDELTMMSDEEVREFRQVVHPITKALLKVSSKF
jgi:hypothetical protein